MLRCFCLRRFSSAYFLMYTTLLITGCSQEHKHIDVSGIPVTIKAERFEKDLVTHVDNIAYLRSRYTGFFELFTNQLVQMGTTDTLLLKSRLIDFVGDSDIVNIYSDVEKMYTDLSLTDEQLTDGFRHYRFYFPDKIVPQVVTYISGFNYAIVSADSILAIG